VEPAPSTTTPSTTAPPTTAPPTTAPPTTTPPVSGSSACITAELLGRCGPYAGYGQISGADSQPWVGQDVWSGDTAYRQQLFANNPGDWYVTANANTNFGGVLTYPNTGFYMAGTIDSFTSITSSFSTTFPHNAATAGWAAYDLWFNNWADEVMIQTDISANSFYDCSPVVTATFGGEPWHLCVFGSERVWKHGTDDSHPINQASGTVDVRAMLTWMEQHGYLPAGSTWTSGSFGFEICDTGGTTEKFQLNGFSWTAR
jgi:hypothetical protein